MKNDLEKLKKYYEKVFQDGDSIGCACNANHMHPKMDEALGILDPEIVSCPSGSYSPLPPDLEGCTVLDLGCGSGRTAFSASRLAGEKGKVIGVDPREALLERAEKKLPGQMKKFRYKNSNVEFLKGYPEDLASLGIQDNTVDVVVANEIVNLSPAKKAVFSELLRVLKPGGELCFTTIVADRRLPDSLSENSSLLRAGLAGALYSEDFRRLLREIGCNDYRIYSKTPIAICNPEASEKVGLASFSHRVVRTFKLPLEDICEDYGQVATYRGTMPGFPDAFPLDDHHLFITNKPMLVCGNSGAMVEDTRFGKHFTVTGDKTIHYGSFDCS
jgi:ubiquinone/menaquinone biosynthesis C-methylase UbiE